MAFVRRVPLVNGSTVETRVEVFNLLNTTPFGAPNVVTGSSTFGQISTAGDPRVVQLAVKVMF
jgi:hypothetical protein